MRGRFALLAAAILIALLALWLSGRSDPADATTRPAKPIVEQSATTVPTLPERTTSSAEDTPPPPPIIDEITVEKAEVCEGEENLITVRAHGETPEDDAALHYLIGGTIGQSVAIRGSKAPEKNGVPLEVIVFGRDNVSTVRRVPAFKVKDCKAERQLFVHYRLMPNTNGEFELTATTATRDAKAPTPTRWKWTFGDGQTAVTDEPVVKHDYGHRAQKALYSNFLIACEAIAGDDRVLGRTALQLLNPAYETLAKKNIASLMIDLNPRFPELGADGVVRQHVHLWHHGDGPITIDAIEVERGRRDDQAGPPHATVPVAQVLPDPAIPPSGIDVTVALNTVAEPDIAVVTYLLRGHTADGRPAAGSFSVLRPPDPPTREHSVAINDPNLEARIRRAQAVLGKPVVTDEDLWKLEREGAFKDLVHVDAPPPAAPPPRQQTVR